MPPKVSASGEDAMVSAAPTADGRLDRSTRFFYGLGSVAFGVKDNGFSYMLMLFYNQVLGVPAKLVALALLTALVFDAVIDPVIGHLSDNLRSRWGRRHPFMYAAALPVALRHKREGVQVRLATFPRLWRVLHDLADDAAGGRWIALGGGGYNVDVLPRWPIGPVDPRSAAGLKYAKQFH
jgi:hypothetical protein